MENFLPVLTQSALFSGIAAEEMDAVLSCLAARRESFPKGAVLLHSGERLTAVGLVLSGSVLLSQEDFWGNRNILSRVTPGQTFGAAFACADGAVFTENAEAETPVTVLFLDVQRVLTVCSAACEHHSRIIHNLLGELAGRNLTLSEKLTHMGQRSTRAKLMSYFSAQAQRQGNRTFEIPFSRQQLADYLAVERSGLSLELGKMRDDGLLEFHKNRFTLL